MNWRGGKTTLENTEFLIGRMYRRQIAEDGLVIRLAAVRDQELAWEASARVNDPLYLMAPSMTPAPFNSIPMFQPWGETGKQPVQHPCGGQDHRRYDGAPGGRNPGHGKRGHSSR